MASSMLQELPLTSTPLDLKALEDKVVRAIDALNRARAAKAKLEDEIDNLKLEVMGRDEQMEKMQSEISALRKDQEEARGRVERMIAQIDSMITAEAEA